MDHGGISISALHLATVERGAHRKPEGLARRAHAHVPGQASVGRAQELFPSPRLNPSSPDGLFPGTERSRCEALRSSSRSRDSVSRSDDFRTLLRFPLPAPKASVRASCRIAPAARASRAAFRHPDRCELYSPSSAAAGGRSHPASRRTCPHFSMTDRNLYDMAVKRTASSPFCRHLRIRRGRSRASLALPRRRRSVPFEFHRTGGSSVESHPASAASRRPGYSKHFLHSCLANLLAERGYEVFSGGVARNPAGTVTGSTGW